MRVVVFGSGHPYRGGVARTTTEMVDGLVDRGHDVLFLTPKRQYPPWLFPGASDRDPDACRRLACARRALDPLNPLSWAASRAHATAFGGAAWIIPYWTWAWAGLWRSLLRGERPPTVAVVHNPADHGAGWVRRRAACSVLGRCQALFTHATSLEHSLEVAYPGIPTRSYPLPSTEVAAAPDRDSARIELDLPLNRRVALFLGLIRPYKGLDLLIEAAAGLPEASDWLVLVAGEPWGGLGAELTRQVRDLRLGDRVRLDLGWVPETRVPGLLAATDLVVLPYRSGSQSAVAPMALNVGVPVLTTDVGGLSEVVRHGVDGWVVEPGSIEALTSALVELDRPMLKRLARGAFEGRDRFTWDGYAAALEALIERVI